MTKLKKTKRINTTPEKKLKKLREDWLARKEKARIEREFELMLKFENKLFILSSMKRYIYITKPLKNYKFGPLPTRGVIGPRVFSPVLL